MSNTYIKNRIQLPKDLRHTAGREEFSRMWAYFESVGKQGKDWYYNLTRHYVEFECEEDMVIFKLKFKL